MCLTYGFSDVIYVDMYLVTFKRVYNTCFNKSTIVLYGVVYRLICL